MITCHENPAHGPGTVRDAPPQPVVAPSAAPFAPPFAARLDLSEQVLAALRERERVRECVDVLATAYDDPRTEALIRAFMASRAEQHGTARFWVAVYCGLGEQDARRDARQAAQ